MRVEVYRNLNRDCLSVKCLALGSERYGLVVSYEQKVHISSPKFVVQDSGRERVRERGVRSVHAFVRGEWDEREKVLYGEPVTYNPFEHDHFVHAESDRPVESAELAAVTTNGVRAKGLSYRNE
jgi:hypothetical protein